jgi:CheY-like chemotaxis protein
LFSHARILIVDSSAENRDILCTLLERLGAETIEASRTRHASRLARHAQPDVIVFDAEADHAPSAEAIDALGLAAHRSSTPIVVLGTQKRCLSRITTGHFVSKPYQYSTLIRRIEEVLGDRA